MKIKLTLFIGLLLIVSQTVQAQTRYVVDSLNTFIHSGPGTKYRIIGAVKAGDSVTLVGSGKSNGYIKINTGRKTGWIDAKLLSSKPGLGAQLASSQRALKIAQEKVAAADKTLNAKTAKLSADLAEKEQTIEQLLLENSNLKLQLSTAQEQQSRLQNELDNLDQTTKMRWLAYGGTIAFVFLVAGWLIPYLPRKKKQHDHWM